MESNENGEKKIEQNTSNNDLPKSSSNDSGRSKDSGRSSSGGRRDRNRSRRRSRSPIRSREDRSNKIHRRVYVANIPFDVKWGELKDLFRDKVGNVRFCQLFENEEGKPRGCGLVEFEDSASAKKAIDVLNRFDYKGRELVVKEDLDIDRDRFGRLILSSGREDRERDRDRRRDRYDDRYSNGSDSGSTPYHTYGLSPQFLNSLGIKGPLTNRVFVANLDYKVSERKLEDIFGLAGKVTKVRLYCDHEGKSKGFGVVEFEHPVEAVQAISMFNNQKLYDRILSVRLDKFDNEDPFGKDGLPAKLPRGLESIGKGLGIDGQPLNIAKSISSPAPSMQGQSLPVPSPITPQASNVTPQAATAAINVLSNLAGHLPSLTQSLAQFSNNPSGTIAPQPAASTGYPSSTNDIPGSGNTVPGASATGYGHSGYTSVVPHGNGTAQPAAPYPTTSPMMPPSSYGTAPPPTSSVPYSANAGTPNAPISSYSTYDQRGDYRDDKYRTSGIDTIFVRNLPPNFSWQNLRDRFNEVGEVRFAEIKGHGTALVRFGSDRDAQRAVDLMNGIRIENRAIEVSLYY
ncbi:hypothetical protein DERF_000289 [Dermatophagoides farinae]|uniref:Myelin expression factor 2-like protein n=2 Tax=Dermatophagoides farinae TaxID=6954 RepID=A0A922I8C8_DERFA|nr:myelin expression factor 2-like protein [Dermatophagoides farinae]KAH9526187.1 hypothetical protein DERF_000289 [Dermatophagoides farinae]